MPTTTLKIPDRLKTRFTRLARAKKRTAHSVMIEALEREVSREERMQVFVNEALAVSADIAAGGDVYAAEDVHAWLDRMVKNRKAARPKPWRK